MKIYKERLPPTHANIASTLNNIATVYETLGENQDALKYLREALNIYNESLPKSHPSIQSTLKSIEAIEKKL